MAKESPILIKTSVHYTFDKRNIIYSWKCRICKARGYWHSKDWNIVRKSGIEHFAIFHVQKYTEELWWRQ